MPNSSVNRGSENWSAIMVLVEKPQLSLTSSENHNNDKSNKLINKKKRKAWATYEFLLL